MKDDDDKVMYPKTPDSLVGSKNDGDSDEVKFSISRKSGKYNDRMPNSGRYNEYR